MRINARGIRFIPQSHTLHIAMDSVVDSINTQDYMGPQHQHHQPHAQQNYTSSPSIEGYPLQMLRWWEEAPATLQQQQPGYQSSTADVLSTVSNQWRTARCIPARQGSRSPILSTDNPMHTSKASHPNVHTMPLKQTQQLVAGIRFAT